MPKTSVKDVMSTKVSTLGPDTALLEIAREMTHKSISCVVICAEGEPVGVISERDLSHLLGRLLDGEDTPQVARDVMSTPPVTVVRDATVGDAMDVARQKGIRRLVVVDERGKMAGLITQTDLLRAHSQELDRHRASLEETIARRTAELTKANRLLEEMALKDSLLGIGNRRAMEIELEKLENVAQRYGRAYSVALLDVDHFKSYNDCYGHPEGDVVLQRVARELSRIIRTTDSLYRYGGEEMLMLMPETLLEGARQAAERARQGIEALEIRHRGTKLGVLTMSLGVAESHSCSGPSGSDWQEVVQRADRALYMAKSEGRNRVCYVSPEGMLVGANPGI